MQPGPGHDPLLARRRAARARASAARAAAEGRLLLRLPDGQRPADPAADARVDPELRSIARYQAARYSRDCRVFAPVYRQITLAGHRARRRTPERRGRAPTATSAPPGATTCATTTSGRGVVLIGHSQGTFLLRRLLASEIDRKPALRRRLVSALLLGGNVHGRRRAATPAATSATSAPAARARQLGCVVAFSTFDAPVPADARVRPHDRAGARGAVHEPGGARAAARDGRRVLPSAPFAPGTTFGAVIDAIGFPQPTRRRRGCAFPDAYSARCSSEGGASALQITPLRRRAGAPAIADADLGPAPRRREHRARQPGPARAPPGRALRALAMRVRGGAPR